MKARVYAAAGGNAMDIGRGYSGSSNGSLTIGDDTTLVFTAGSSEFAGAVLNDSIGFTPNAIVISNVRTLHNLVMTPWTSAPGLYYSTHTVAYDDNVDTEVIAMPVDEEVLDSDKATEPDEPARSRYDFDGWFTDTACTPANEWDFANDTVSEDTTLYAKWLTHVRDITYNANGGTGTVTVQKYKDDTIEFHDGTGFARDGFVIDGWTIVSIVSVYALGGLYDVTDANVVAYAIWEPDADETNAGTSPTDASDKPINCSITGTITEGGVPVANIRVVLNSTARFTYTDANGEFSFINVSESEHTLSLRRNNNHLARYTLNFDRTGNNSTIVDDDASGDNSGVVTTTVAGNFTSLHLNISESSGYWILSNASYSAVALPSASNVMAINPQTGENVQLGIGGC